MPHECSLLISTWNEEQFLPYMLRWTRHWFNDCVVLDNHSTDKTVEIARKFECRIYQEENLPADNWGAAVRLTLQDKAQYDWCFHVDADELVDANMLEKITHWTKPDSPDRQANVVAFKFPRYNPNLWPDNEDQQIRLVDRRYVSWHRPVHPEPILKRTGVAVDEPETVNGKVIKYCQTLKMHPIIHLQYFRNLNQLQETRARWARMETVTGIKPPTEQIVK